MIILAGTQREYRGFMMVLAGTRREYRGFLTGTQRVGVSRFCDDSDRNSADIL